MPASTPQVSGWEYDELGRRTRHTVGGQVDLGYQYNSLGQLDAIVAGAPNDPNAPSLVGYKYDDLGRPRLAVRHNVGAHGFIPAADADVTTSWTYDDLNRTYTETTQVGAGAAHTVTTAWTLGSTWTRDVTLPSGMLAVTPGTNAPATINGRYFTGHALDQMQSRGFTPTIVENAIQHGARSRGNQAGTFQHVYEGVRVITNDAGGVITVIPQ